ncbi:hypothetical protein I3843_04G178500 [Carya illinoinensis]|uniref:Uncharacterized protein n=1 Tax=Carya illinoinensis TaxID=32201 RepID=A0A922JSP7_CARIL|nr:hypothetical protein I3842_04G188200 [Carya illinoinensis]KAG6719136.1 hypothetical protein I3842_04G188200 [Carya illinoinensis]KAG7984787.1 hypothetical protein I3843_04G178500 [Carya illinoinensis]
MGCFLVCFGSTKNARKQRKQSQNKFHPRDNVRTVDYKPVQSAISLIQGNSESPNTKQILQVRDESEKELSFKAGKKVTFDSNVKTHEHVTCGEAPDLFLQREIGGKGEENIEKPSQSKSSSEDSLITSSSGSYPPNYRYQNCRDSDDEYEELDCEDTNLDDEDDDGGLEDDGLYADDDEGIVRSRRTISVANVFTEEADSPKPICALPDGEMEPVGSNQYARRRSAYVHPVLNPVENLTQWKAVKAKGEPPLKPQKENFVSDRETQVLSASEPSFNGLSFSFESKTDQSKKPNQEIAVDASLSNWLVPSESPVNKTSRNNLGIISPEKSMSQGSSSSRCQDDRPILGALTVEELKQFSASSTPRKSPSRSPDEIPIIGTVGTYWSRAVPAKDFGSASSLPSKKYQTRPASMDSYM